MKTRYRPGDVLVWEYDEQIWLNVVVRTAGRYIYTEWGPGRFSQSNYRHLREDICPVVLDNISKD